MKLTVELNNIAKSPLRIGLVKKVIRGTLEKSGIASAKKIIVSLASVSENEIKKLNQIYRKENRPTDILTFPEYKNNQDLKKALVRKKEIFLGEVILCYNDIVAHSGKAGKNLKKELAEVIAHGALHLLGWRHGKKMFEVQKEVAAVIK